MERIQSGLGTYKPEYSKPVNGGYIALTVGLGFVVYLLLWGTSIASIVMLAKNGNKAIYGSLLSASVVFLIAFHVNARLRSKRDGKTSFSIADNGIPSITLSMRNLGTSVPKRDSLVTHTSDTDFNDQQNAFVTSIPYPQGRRYNIQTEKTDDKIFVFYTVKDRSGRPQRMVEVTQRPKFSSRVIGSIKSRTRRKR
ncbi:hypothetical protein EXVG_00134 [Emiliania huxleyi virus 202]|nr:hypothetical protein EXVG_00134 [Emiliania huxleyi virus 202]AHA54058.1 putative membrane protein [Emiliania huxleyi virus 18]AHA55108.1 putative membrane protein [Emiliania huxleyi virus 156]